MSGLSAENGHAGFFHRVGEVQRRLATELDDDPVQRSGLFFGLKDFDDVFFGQRLEIEPVRSVVIGRDRLRVGS